MQIRFIPDEPILATNEDVLGVGGFVNRIYDSLQQTQTPFVYGLLGPWGSGKTSIQRLLAAKFDAALGSPQGGGYVYVPVWLDAWKYENQENMIFPLLHAFRGKRQVLIGGEVTAQFLGALRDVVATSALSLLDLGLRGVTKMLTGDAMKLKDVKENLELIESDRKDDLETILTTWAKGVDGLSASYHAFIKTFAAEVGRKLHVDPDTVRFVVLIDDLDRCLPEVAVKVLENIKNHLSVPSCVYVLGINPAVIHRGIRSKYKDLEISGREYLEKILNYSFEVPTAGRNLLENYGTGQLARLLTGGTVDERNAMQGALDTFGQALASCPFSNPRKIKRILNTYLFYVRSTPELNDAAIEPPKRLDLAVTVKLIILAEYYPEMFRAACANPGVIELVAEALRGTAEAADKLRSQYALAVDSLLTELSTMPGLVTMPLSPTRPSLRAHIGSVREIARRV